jgi:hypothetical protein
MSRSLRWVGRENEDVYRVNGCRTSVWKNKQDGDERIKLKRIFIDEL